MKKSIVVLFLLLFTNYCLLITGCSAAEFFIDHFEKNVNCLGGRTSTYEQPPSRVMAIQTEKERYGTAGKSLAVKYDKQNTGGPRGEGGWCGYYSILKIGQKYFDAAPYTKLTFWVKGEKGGENFKIGLADRHWEQVGDSVKSEEVGVYLPATHQITAEWQKVTIPLDVFFIDMKEVASVTVCFEPDCFPEGKGAGIVYIDELAFE
ncbi:MAG: hypothetical protein NTV07_01735 [Candidatus Omnitrophica bacterium]|nr:hypothetical protein [Candidatus Omnitrophota bacterium]